MSKLKEIISNAINEELIKTMGNQSKAALNLGIARATLRGYMNKAVFNKKEKATAKYKAIKEFYKNRLTHLKGE